jgi:hypothetical protein
VVRAAAADASDASGASDQKIRIKLKSYWIEMLAEAVEKIRDAADSTSARISGPVYLPTRYSAPLRCGHCLGFVLSAFPS